MTTDPVFWRHVREFVELYGPDAEQEALKGALTAHREGNRQDAAGWLTVYDAVLLLNAGFRPEADPVN